MKSGSGSLVGNFVGKLLEIAGNHPLLAPLTECVLDGLELHRVKIAILIQPLKAISIGLTGRYRVSWTILFDPPDRATGERSATPEITVGLDDCLHVLEHDAAPASRSGHVIVLSLGAWHTGDETLKLSFRYAKVTHADDRGFGAENHPDGLAPFIGKFAGSAIQVEAAMSLKSLEVSPRQTLIEAVSGATEGRSIFGVEGEFPATRILVSGD